MLPARSANQLPADQFCLAARCVERILAALVTQLDALSRREPVLMVYEDDGGRAAENGVPAEGIVGLIGIRERVMALGEHWTSSISVTRASSSVL